MKHVGNLFLFSLAFLSSSLLGAQRDCVTTEQTHYEAEMPKGSFEWFFAGLDDQHTQASLTFATEIKGAVFFQALAQREDNALYEYVFPLEALDHPLTTDAKQIEFVISNEQLDHLVIQLQYLEQPYLECSDKKSYSYYVNATDF